VAVDCFADQQQLCRTLLATEAQADFAGVGYGWPAGNLGLLDRAAVVVTRSLHELSGGVATRLSGAAAVVVTAPWPGSAEEELGGELHVRRLVRALPDEDALVEERADTEFALVLALVRRTHALARELHRGQWLPPHGAYRGARRCSALTVGLLGLDSSTLPLTRRAAAFGMHSVFVHPLPSARDGGAICEPSEADCALVADVVAAGAVACRSVATLLATADVLLLHSRPEAGTVLGPAELGGLRGGQFLVSTCPGGLHTHSLLKALHSGHLVGAALDVPDADAFLEAAAREAPGLILTQRAAAHSDDFAHSVAEPAMRAALAVLRGSTTS
jgi:phosphoglycerate dehydrogenase-like enzyme